MKLTRPTDDELGEYVDGRLSERRRAEIAAWLLDNPRKAAEIERLRELNDALKGVAGDVLSEPVPDRLREVLRGRPVAAAEPSPAKRFFSGWTKAAAAFVIFALGSATGWGTHAVLHEGVSEIDWLLADASYAFGFYTDHYEPAVEFPATEQARFASVASRIFQREIPAPDLQAAGYEYVGARVLPAGARASALLLFKGDREEDDLTVFVWPAEQSPEAALSARLQGDVAARYGVHKGLGFAVMGAKDNGRLDEIASEVAKFYQTLGPGSEPADLKGDRS